MLEIPDPFAPDRVFHINPARCITRCQTIYAARGTDHGECRHCPELRERVARALEASALLGALEPVVDPETIHAKLAFEESAKPWGVPGRGPTDTQPIAIVNEGESGFEVIDAD
jgi:hypothetical protein